MFYNFELEIAEEGSEDELEELTVKLTHGVITHVEVEFPPGCAGLAYAYVRDGLHQLWPTNADGKFRTDGRVIMWNEYYEFFRAPYTLILGGWNLDDTYPHTITFRFEVTPQQVAERGVKELGILARLGKILLGR